MPLNPFRTADVPLMARPAFAAEMRHMALWGVFAGLVEGNTSSIVVAKTFQASELLTTVVWTTPMLANMLSLWSAAAIRGRRRTPLFLWLAAGAILGFASVGLTPADWAPWGGWLFAAQVAFARVMLAALLTVRTSIWNANYPAAQRAHLSGRLQRLRLAVGLLAGSGVGLLFDVDPAHYRWVYPLVGVIATISLLPVRRLKVRHESRYVAQFRAARRGQPSVIGTLRESWHVLRQDRAFASYCSAQYFLGSANFMVDPILLVILTQRLEFSYLAAAALLDLLPNAILLFTIGAWARHFDRVGVLRFRVGNSWIWLASCILAMLGVALLQFSTPSSEALLRSPLAWTAVALLIAARAFNGVGRSGGAIAWNLGHLHFADRQQADLYMGIHVALTGVRGLIMPFVALLMFRWIGWWALAIATLSCAVALRQFSRLAADADSREFAVVDGDESP